MDIYYTLKRLNEMERALHKIYYEQDGIDPKGGRISEAIDLIGAVAHQIAMMANDESREIREAKKRENQ